MLLHCLISIGSGRKAKVGGPARPKWLRWEWGFEEEGAPSY